MLAAGVCVRLVVPPGEPVCAWPAELPAHPFGALGVQITQLPPNNPPTWPTLLIYALGCIVQTSGPESETIAPAVPLAAFGDHKKICV